MENIQPTNYISNQIGNLSPLESLRGKNIGGKEQLKKVSVEFEAIFVSKMLTSLDKTVDKEGSLFGESKFMDNFKSIMFNDMGRQIASNPHSNIGFAKQMYAQMEKSVPN